MSFCTCHHERAYALHAALHGGFHQGGEAVAVPSLDVQAGVVVEQVVGDCYVALKAQKGGSACLHAHVGFARPHLCMYARAAACQHETLLAPLRMCTTTRMCTLPA